MNKEILLTEFTFKAIRSSGPGGQHVNKVSSKVVLSVDLLASKGLSSQEKDLLRKSIAARLKNDGILQLSCDESRSQVQNKTKVIARFFRLIKVGLFVKKKRLTARPSKASIRRVKEKKRVRGQLKNLRKKPDINQ